ncbi:gamma-aminobutyric acid type B receptor subunit 2-like [Glandiceps talaboti]
MTNGKIPLYIGGLFPHDHDGFYGSLLESAERAIEHVNNSTGVLDDYEIRMIWRPIMKDQIENVGLALNALFDFVYRSHEVVYIWGPTFSSSALDLNQVAPYYNIPQITMGASAKLGNKVVYNYTSQIYPDIYAETHSAVVRHFGWSRVSVVVQDTENWLTAMQVLIRLLENDNVTVLSVSSLKSDNAHDVIRVLKSFDTRITIFHMYRQPAADLLCAAYKQGMYGPRYVYIIPGWYYKNWWRESPTDCTIDEMNTVSNGYIGLDAFTATDQLKRINFTGKPPNDEEMDFYKYFRRSILETYSYDAYSYDMIWTMAIALNAADNILRHRGDGKRIHKFTYNDSDIAKLVWEETRKLVVHGMTGIIAFDDNAVRYGPNAIEQLQDGKEIIVCSYEIFTDEVFCTDELVHFIWEDGIPPVDGVTHVQNILTLSDVYIWVIYSLTTIEVLLAIGLIGMSIVYRNNRVMKLSSAMVTIFIPIGCLMLSSSVYLFGMDLSRVSPETVKFTCQIREGFIWIGLSLGFGALFAKTYRVHVIFNNALRKMKTAKYLSDGNLIFFIMTLVTLDGALLAVRLIVDTSSLTSVFLEPSMDLSHPPQEIMITPVVKLCSSKYQLYFLLVVLINKSILFMFGTLLAWKTRNVQVTELNDSQYIALSVYVTVVTCIIATPVGIVMQTNMNAIFMVVGGAILIANIAVMSLVYVPKIILMRKEQRHPGTSNRKTFLFGKDKRHEYDNTSDRRVVQDLSEKLKRKQKLLQKMKLLLSSVESVLD